MSDYTQSTLPDKSNKEKALFRARSIDILRKISNRQARLLDHRVRAALMRKISMIKPKSVMLYIPLSVEPDIIPMINRLRRERIAIYVPFMEGESFRLVQYRLPLRKKKYGVREPNFSKKYRTKKIDIAIVPILGTDPTWRRVGFGKGMYDRFFAHSDTFVGQMIFVQRVLQYSKTIITDHWDIMADEVITAK